jgi:hypothetical protein
MKTRWRCLAGSTATTTATKAVEVDIEAVGLERTEASTDQAPIAARKAEAPTATATEIGTVEGAPTSAIKSATPSAAPANSGVETGLQLLILLIIAALVTALAIWLWRRRPGDRESSPAPAG